MDRTPSRNIGLDLVRVTEATALTAGRWLGLGNREMTHRAATEAMSLALASINIDGYIVIGEEGRIKEHTPLDTGRRVGTGQGPEVDVVVDPIDGTIPWLPGERAQFRLSVSRRVIRCGIANRPLTWIKSLSMLTPPTH